jgi:hypothetical protein
MNPPNIKSRIMNQHVLLDRLAIRGAELAGKGKRFFGEELESASIREHINATHIEIHDIDLKGENMIEAITAQGPVYAYFKVTRWVGYEAPTLIFTHCRGDQPYYKRLESIFPNASYMPHVNLIATGSPFNYNKKEYALAMGRLRGYVRMLAVTAVLTERILQFIKKKNKAGMVVGGLSFGGWVSNIHKAYFNSADEYRPMLAGARPDDMFLHSYYNKMVADNALSRPEKFINALNFELDFLNSNNSNVFPLLGKFDQYVELGVQSICYKPENTTLIDKGHQTTSMANDILREHLMKAFPKDED